MFVAEGLKCGISSSGAICKSLTKEKYRTPDGMEGEAEAEEEEAPTSTSAVDGGGWVDW